MKEIKITEAEKKCLEVLVEYYGSYEGEFCLPFKHICPEGMELKKVRRHVRALARKGLAKFYRGLMDDDGMVAGAGYSATEEGANLIESITPTPL
jgi:hypothetical protein